MLRKTIITALMAAVVLPAAATAQSREEVRRSARDVREERRDLRDAYRHGDRRDVRDARRDLRDARQDVRDYRDRNWGRNDWQRHRAGNRALYARGQWRAPFRYNAFRPGVRIAPTYYGQRYWIADPWRYRLPRAAANARWIRHYNDAILVDYRRGVVIDVIRNFYW